MSQQQFFQPQYPGQPQQPAAYPQQPQTAYPQQIQQPGFPPAQQFPGYPPQAVPQAQPTQPLAQGSLSDFYNQPSSGTGPSLSWTNPDSTPKPIGTMYVGVVARDVTSGDVQQQTDFNTKQPLFYRDGRPKFAMKVPLKVQPSTEHPEGEASWYVKGQSKDELQRAMSAAGVEGAPKEGAVISITLVQRRPSGRGMNPANIVRVEYQPAGGQQAAPAPVQAEQPIQAAPVSPQVPMAAPQVPQQIQQPAIQAVPQMPQQVQQPAAQPVQPQLTPVPNPVQQQAAPAQMAMPEGLSPEQQELFARLAGGQQAVGQ